MERGEWERAAALHTAPFLDGFYLSGAEEFEKWVELERQRLADHRAHALESLAEGAPDPAAAVHWWRMLAAAEPYSSRVVLKLIDALERSGDRAAAVRQARTHTVLTRELGIEPDPAVLACAERLRTARASAEPETGGAIVAPTAEDAPVPASRDEPFERVEPRATSRDINSPARQRAAVLALPVAAGLLALAVAVITLRSDGPGRAASRAAPTAIAVLPFADQSPQGDQEYFADGITDELIVSLSRVSGLNVVGGHLHSLSRTRRWTRARLPRVST